MYQTWPRVWKAEDQRLFALSSKDLEEAFSLGQKLLVNYVIHYLLEDSDTSVLHSWGDSFGLI